MNGCQSRNINHNDDSSTESNPLVKITDIGTKIGDYVISIKRAINNLNISNKADIAKIDELQELVKYQGERLLHCIKQYGVGDSELVKKTEEITAMLISLHVRLTKLKNMCNANKTAPIDVMVDKVAKSVRAQVSCALDLSYS